MPIFGGLLKKRRTKDPKASKDLQSTASSSAESPSSVPSASSQRSSPQLGQHSTVNTSASAAPPERPIDAGTSDATQLNISSATPDVRAGATGDSTVRSQMNSQQIQNHSPVPGGSPQPVSPQHHQNVASIKNIINPPQQEEVLSQGANDGRFPSQQPVRTTQRQLKGKYSLNDFTLRRTLGTGSFGRVHLVQSVHNQRFYAIKVLKKQQVVKMKQVEHTNDERRMLERVKHPFLITLWGTFQDAKNLYMVMDFVEGGELFSLLRKSQRFPNPVAKFYAAEVTLALEYLHSQNIVYRDLKPENLLLDRHGHLKITDFGFAKEVRDITWTLCGTPDYLAPEVVSSKGYNKSVDWWSLGILIFEMLCGFTPFWDSGSPMKIYENIVHGRVKYPPFLVPDARDLLSQLITPDLTKRLGNLRGGSEDVKNHAWFSEVTWDRLARKDIDAPYIPPVKAGQGDASQFDTYPEETEQYGLPADDEFGHFFQEF
ncbi:AGC/PKA protein kinase [Coccidioides immitis RS]|uniref:cAMP-dependent protein kinase n=3 Tax=Coccidioides immitis TaxID=5501 RepID=A0A0E1S3V3_COCIM|nr:AGC/PKA protein kinase [Coccidioides immitis RS]EAS34359.1 AGC/PKA protein kinase [Coccidioides immitis RS]TPX21816.1 camp-dependent protein kinase catalytic subunit [Coccidioides immitis]